MNSKEEYTAMVATERSRAAKQEYILKAHKTDTFSATKPVSGYEAEEEGAA